MVVVGCVVRRGGGGGGCGVYIRGRVVSFQNEIRSRKQGEKENMASDGGRNQNKRERTEFCFVSSPKASTYFRVSSCLPLVRNSSYTSFDIKNFPRRIRKPEKSTQALSVYTKGRNRNRFVVLLCFLVDCWMCFFGCVSWRVCGGCFFSK